MESTNDIDAKLINVKFEKYKNLVEELDKRLNDENKKNTIEIQKESKFKNFKEWLNINGAVYEQNFEYPTSYGLFNIVGIKSRKKIYKNQALLFIPKHLIIDSSQLRKTEEFEKIFSIPDLKELEKLNVLIIVIFLLKEYTKLFDNQNSFFKEYIDLIDSESLIFWEEELLQQLDEPNIIEVILEHKQDLLFYYSQLEKYLIIDTAIVNFERFALYYSFVLSRNFYVNDNQLLLVPLADALNHKHVHVKYEIFDSKNFVCKHTLYFDDSIKGKRMKGTDNSLFYSTIQINHKDQDELDIPDNNSKESLEFLPQDYFMISTIDQEYNQGEQIYNFYGEHSNEYLLKWYGFCYFNNIHDYVTISLHLPKYEDYEFDRYLQIFFEKHLTETYKEGEVYNTLNFDVFSGRINFKLMNYVRFFYFYENDSVSKFANFNFDINIEIEVIKRTIELLEISYANKSKRYSMEDDLKGLKNIFDECNTYSKNDINLLKNMIMSNILIFRISQKMNLLHQIDLCYSILKIFDNVINFENQTKTRSRKTSFHDNNYVYDFENDQIYIDNKKKIGKYFKKFHLV